MSLIYSTLIKLCDHSYQLIAYTLNFLISMWIMVRLHAAIWQARFVSWRVKNTTDHNLKCDFFTRAHSITYVRVRIGALMV